MSALHRFTNLLSRGVRSRSEITRCGGTHPTNDIGDRDGALIRATDQSLLEGNFSEITISSEFLRMGPLPYD
jgi:hypothetical protein